jgi:hypothetical protein
VGASKRSVRSGGIHGVWIGVDRRLSAGGGENAAPGWPRIDDRDGVYIPGLPDFVCMGSHAWASACPA